jgi:hypothetical protein
MPATHLHFAVCRLDVPRRLTAPFARAVFGRQKNKIRGWHFHAVAGSQSSGSRTRPGWFSIQPRRSNMPCAGLQDSRPQTPNPFPFSGRHSLSERRLGCSVYRALALEHPLSTNIVLSAESRAALVCKRKTVQTRGAGANRPGPAIAFIFWQSISGRDQGSIRLRRRPWSE